MASFLRTGRKIVAIGFNYAEHAKELSSAIPKEPIFFLKPTSSYLANNGTVEIPKGCIVHHEGILSFFHIIRCILSSDEMLVELGVVIGRQGRDIPASQADSHVAGYGKMNNIPLVRI